ncbi:MAG: 3-phosphoshikimate 1-carboxyvinyltransferase [Defluviitaleaceae bacterium]|nr:3-phosphoshikimate 1-carboxyvinyltransferase [Defluviitaleaceae bacterium]
MSQAFDIKISPGGISGNIAAVPSKSHLHRLLICASLADKETVIKCVHTGAEDIKATIACLSALGAVIEKIIDGFIVTPIHRDKLPKACILPCMESGSTLRFMLPVVCALGICGEFHLSGRLPERPISSLEAALTRAGIQISRPKSNIISCKGQLNYGSFHLPGNISSQYITGLLLALPLLNGRSRLTITEPIESQSYIALTLEVLEAFGEKPKKNLLTHYEIDCNTSFISPHIISAEGDWSNAAFWLCAGAMPGGNIQLCGLNKKSLQGDRQICVNLQQIGAVVKWEGKILNLSEGSRRGIEIDAANIPDLIPAIAAVAAVSEGTTLIKNAARLRLKESDRLSAITHCLNTLGANITEEAEGLLIQGVSQLKGGMVDSFGDHRIAMMAAIASAACTEPVIIKNAHTANKSYPNFYEKLSGLGKKIEVQYG